MFSFAKKLVDRLEGVNAHEPDTYFKNTLSRNHGYGLRVLHVESESSASKHGFESWFDYIVGIADHDLPVKAISHNTHNYLINEDGSFNYGTIPLSEQAQMVDFDMIAQELASIANSPNPNVNMEVWNAKGGVLRTISLSLSSRSDKAEPKTLSQPATLKLNLNFNSLGLTVQSQHMNSATFVWKVLNTQQALPAFRALLVPYSDYIIGCDSAFSTDEHVHGLLSMGGENLLTRTIYSYYKAHLETLNDDKVPIILYVYNHEYDIVRKVTVHLSSSWSPGGNKGILGCDVGYGLLHRLPLVVGKFDSSLGVLTDDIYQNNDDYSYKFQSQAATIPAAAASFTSSAALGQVAGASASEQAPLPLPISQAPIPPLGTHKPPTVQPPPIRASMPPPQNFHVQYVPPAQAPVPPPVAQTSVPPPVAQASVPPPVAQASVSPSTSQSAEQAPLPPPVTRASEPSPETQAPLPSADSIATVPAPDESVVSDSQEQVNDTEQDANIAPKAVKSPEIYETETPFSEQESHDFFANLGEEIDEKSFSNSKIEIAEQDASQKQPASSLNEEIEEYATKSQAPPRSIISDPKDEFETIPLTEEPTKNTVIEETLLQAEKSVSQTSLPQQSETVGSPVPLPKPQTVATQAPLPSAFQEQAPLPRQGQNTTQTLAPHTPQMLDLKHANSVSMSPYTPQTLDLNHKNSVSMSPYQPPNAQMAPAASSPARSTASVGPPPMVSGITPQSPINSLASSAANQAPPTNSQAPPFMHPSFNNTQMPPASIRPGRRRKHVPHANLDALNDIMNEELLKSKESDYMLDPSAALKEAANLPPPPRF